MHIFGCNIMYCFYVSSWWLCFGNKVSDKVPFELLKLDYSFAKAISNPLPTINKQQVPKRPETRNANKGKMGNQMNAKVNVYNSSVL